MSMLLITLLYNQDNFEMKISKYIFRLRVRIVTLQHLRKFFGIILMDDSFGDGGNFICHKGTDGIVCSPELGLYMKIDCLLFDI